jgi:hypothetical protein
MRVPINPYISNIMVDSCAFDPKYDPEDKASEALFKNDRLNLIVTHSNLKEIDHPNTPNWVKKEASCRLYTIETSLNDDEEARKKKIHEILTGNGKPEKMKQDAEHVFESQKYGGYFVTTDARILSKRDELSKISNARIVKPSELLESIETEYV